MTLPDLINGALEACGGFFIALSVVKLYRAKIVSGVSAIHVAFFSAWGFWNLFYYPHLGQWASFWGGGFLVAVNVVWLAQMVYYNARHKRHIASAIKQGDKFWDIDRAVETEIAAEMEADQFGGFNREPYQCFEFKGEGVSRVYGPKGFKTEVISDGAEAIARARALNTTRYRHADK